jgi:hypothetical protein
LGGRPPEGCPGGLQRWREQWLIRWLPRWYSGRLQGRGGGGLERGTITRRQGWLISWCGQRWLLGGL